MVDNVGWVYGYHSKPISSIEDFGFDKEPYGFIYLINFNDGRRYAGRKNFFTERKVKLGKKELAAITDKRLKTYKVVKKESDWLKYNGSNKLIKERMKDGLRVTGRRILKVAFSPKELTYLETKYLFENDVLTDESYYNDNILGKFYRRDLVS